MALPYRKLHQLEKDLTDLESYDAYLERANVFVDEEGRCLGDIAKEIIDSEILDPFERNFKLRALLLEEDYQ